MGLTIDKSRVSETAWGEVDKAALGRRLAEAYASGDASKALVREAYAFMPEEAFGEDGDGKPLFSFSKGWGPHHELIGDSLVTNRGGVQGAAGALAGARSEPSLSAEEIAKARAHIQRHYRDAEMEAPDSLKERVATDEIASSQKPLLAMTRPDPGLAPASDNCRFACSQLLRSRVVPVVDPLTAVGVLAAILIPVDAEPAAQHARRHERPDVQPHAVIQVRVPADGLLVQRLPAHIDVVGRLALEDQLELVL